MSLPRSRSLSDRASAAREREAGVVMIWTVMVLTILAGLIAAGIGTSAALDRGTRLELAVRGQARAVAEAGLVDAYAWFRRQQVQPVTSFAPRRDLTADPVVNETDDPAVGLLREYEIAPNLWARYEVRLHVPAEAFTDADGNGRYDEGEPFTDADGNAEWDGARGVQDLSLERGLPGPGAVWRLESHGFLFERRRDDLPLGESPNDRIASSVVATEIRRLTITPPSAAALCASTGSNVTLGARARIVGGTSAGVAYASSTGAPVVQAGAEVSGAPASTSQPDYDGSIDAMFGLSRVELRSVADLATSDASSVPSPIGDYSLIVVEGDATFDENRPLRGTGVVVVLGDCTLAAGSNSFFNGILYVEGNLTVRAPVYLRGVVVAGGVVDVRGTGGDYAELQYDDAVLVEILRFLGQYRPSKSLFMPSAEGEEAP